MRARVQGFDSATGVIRVWHSSPYDFDRFSMDRLGLGDGYSTHALGQYFAESPLIGGHGGKYWRQFNVRFMDAALVIKVTGSREAAIEQIHRYLKHKQPDNYELLVFINQYAAKRMREALLLLEGDGTLDGPTVYDVALRADPGQFLTFEEPFEYKGKVYLGKDLYKHLVGELGEKEATIYLNDILRLSGARYLDARSRRLEVRDRSYNYAVWDPTIIEIVGKMRPNRAERTPGEANAVI